MKIESLQNAIDTNGNFIEISQATKGESYFCPFCGVGVYINTSILGNRYYATMPGGVHTAPECEMISMQTQSSKIRYQLERTNPHTFVHRLLREPEPNLNAHPNHILNPLPAGIAPPRLRTLRSLAELYASGIYLYRPETPMGNGLLSDCCACVEPLISNIVDDPMYRGQRILYAAVDDIRGADYMRFNECIERGTPRISFPMFTKYRGKKYRRKYIVLECGTIDLLQSIVGSLYEKALDEYGRTMYRARCKKVLVAGDWRPGSCDDCPHPCDREKRSDCKGVLLTPYVSYRQIFGIPNSEDYEEHEAATNTEDSLASEAEL